MLGGSGTAFDWTLVKQLATLPRKAIAEHALVHHGGALVVGSIDDAVDAIGFWRDLLDLKHICFFLDYPGLSREEMIEQMHLVAEEVFPRLGEPIERRPITGSPLV